MLFTVSMLFAPQTKMPARATFSKLLAPLLCVFFNINDHDRHSCLLAFRLHKRCDGTGTAGFIDRAHEPGSVWKPE